MKKVVFYIDMLGRGGAQRVMSNLVTYFSERGYETVLVNDYIRDESLPHYDVPETVERRYLRKKRQGNVIVKNVGRIIELRKILKRENPDVTLSFLGEPNVRLLIASLGLKTKKVVSVRNDPNKEYGKSKFRKFVANLLFLFADAVVFQTEDASKYFCPVVRKKSRVIFNPVSSAMYADGDGDRRDIITLGRLQPQKNHKMLIDAFAQISDEFPDEHLCIYGDGPDYQKTADYIAEKGMQEKIFLQGNIADVKSALCNAKLFVLSSDYEGLPNALMEAMATGTPSISTDCPCGGPKTLMQNGVHGILVPVKDTESLKNAMEKLLADNALRETLGKNARERAEIFRDEMIYKQWEEYFLELADR